MESPDFFDVYVSLVRSPADEEIPLRDFARLVHVDYEEFLEDLLFNKEYDGICNCEFENPEDPTLDEIDECECIPILTRKEGVEIRVEGPNAFMTCKNLSSALLEMENWIGEEIRQNAYNMVFGAIEEATGVNREDQMDQLDTAIAHCTEEDESALEHLLENTLERVREHFRGDQNP